MYSGLLYNLSDFLDKYKSVVMDFSFIVHDHAHQFMDRFMNLILGKRIEVIVCDSFYETARVFANSSHLYNIDISGRAKNLLQVLNGHELLVHADDIKTVEEFSTYIDESKCCILMGNNSSLLESLKEGACNNNVGTIIVDETNGWYCTTVGLIRQCPDKTPDSILSRHPLKMLNMLPDEGSTLKLGNGKRVMLGKRISMGTEGEIYYTDFPDTVCKIYKEDQLTELRLKKLEVMVNRPVSLSGVCWPEVIAYLPTGEPVGFLMKIAKGKTLSLLLDGEETLHKHFPGWERINLVKLAYSVLQRILYLHTLGLIIGDIRLRNIMVNSDTEVYLIDLDSCQIQNLPCPVGDSEFTPGRLHGKKFSSTLRTFKDETFSVSVLLFMILFLGQHPFNQIGGKDDIEEEIRANSFPYPLSGSSITGKVPPGGYSELWASTPDFLRSMFHATFTGKASFPVASWIVTFSEYIMKLQRQILIGVWCYALFPKVVESGTATPIYVMRSTVMTPMPSVATQVQNPVQFTPPPLSTNLCYECGTYVPVPGLCGRCEQKQREQQKNDTSWFVYLLLSGLVAFVLVAIILAVR